MAKNVLFFCHYWYYYTLSYQHWLCLCMLLWMSSSFALPFAFTPSWLCPLQPFWVKFWRSWSQFHFTSSTVVFLSIVHCRLLPTVVSYSLSTVVSAVAFSLETKSDSVLCCKPVSVLLTAWFHKVANKDSIDYKL